MASAAAAASSLMRRDPVRDGEFYFNKFCSSCHGLKAAGTDRGPTFIDKIYRPAHHSDWSFRIAVRSGVRAHHWSFGDMPPIKGVTPEEVDDIITYVRSLQKAAGII